MHTVIRSVGWFAFGATAVLVLSGCHSQAEPAPPPRPAVVAQALPGQPLITDTYAGEVRARYESALGFRIAGKISERVVDAGARVKKGDVLARLEPQDVNLAVSSARAAVAAAQADLSLADAELERHAAMLEKKYISQALYDARVNAQKAAQARLEQTRAQLAQAQNQSSYTELRADADGVITATTAEIGQVVTAGQPVVKLAHAGDVEVLINVPETRIGAFKADLPVVVEIWARDNKHYAGKVRELSPEADPRARTYDVRVAMTEAHDDVQLGMTARIYLNAGDAPNAVTVPLSALDEREGQPALWLVDGASGKVSLVPVKVGAYREEGVTITQGVAAHAWVVAAGVHKLEEGQVIRPVDRDNKAVKLGAG